MGAKFIKDDTFGLLPDNIRYPYIAFTISPKDFEYIKYMRIAWLEVNGVKLFKVKDENGKDTNEMTAFLIFQPKDINNNGI